MSQNTEAVTFTINPFTELATERFVISTGLLVIASIISIFVLIAIGVFLKNRPKLRNFVAFLFLMSTYVAVLSGYEVLRKCRQDKTDSM